MRGGEGMLWRAGQGKKASKTLGGKKGRPVKPRVSTGGAGYLGTVEMKKYATCPKVRVGGKLTAQAPGRSPAAARKDKEMSLRGTRAIRKKGGLKHKTIRAKKVNRCGPGRTIRYQKKRKANAVPRCGLR